MWRIITNMMDRTILDRESLRLRKDAVYHLQVELDGGALRQSIEEATAPLKGSFYHSVDVPIHGRAVRFFGLRRCSWREGEALFSIPMLSPTDGFFSGPSGIQQKKLLQATHLEVYLNRASSDFVATANHSIGSAPHFVAYEFHVLEDGPTKKPFMSVEEIEERLARREKSSGLHPRKWWELWKERPSAKRYPRIKPATILGLDPPPHRRPRS
jgi:hypothetical protein